MLALIKLAIKEVIYYCGDFMEQFALVQMYLGECDAYAAERNNLRIN